MALGLLRRVALERLARALPRAQDRDVRGRHRLGRDADRPPRQHHVALRATEAGWPDKIRTPRPRCLRRNFWFCMIDDRLDDLHAPHASASRTSSSSPTTPTATAPGPTPRQVMQSMILGDLPVEADPHDLPTRTPRSSTVCRCPRCADPRRLTQDEVLGVGRRRKRTFAS